MGISSDKRNVLLILDSDNLYFLCKFYLPSNSEVFFQYDNGYKFTLSFPILTLLMRMDF
jgi:hypothetical protein